MVLGWLVGSSPSITPILGGSTVRRLDAALDAVRLALGEEHRALLDDAA